MNKFITKAERIHGDRYDYSKVVYQKATVKVVIGCKSHGDFDQTPAMHVSGQGCPVCAKELRRLKLVDRNQQGRKDQDSFIKRAIEKHGNRYDYSKSVFKGIRHKLTIGCRSHGYFDQMAQAHIVNGQGCPVCAKVLRNQIPDFVKVASNLHGSRYDYSHVDFLDKIAGKVKIICSEHGEFLCRAADHIHSEKLQGCRQCSLGATSIQEHLWLDQFGLTNEQRNVPISVSGKTLRVDGFDLVSNTIYEFFGDYWHGNPSNHDPSKMNKQCNKTFGELYQNSINRIQLFKDSGYNVVYIWEHDWKKQNVQKYCDRSR